MSSEKAESARVIWQVKDWNKFFENRRSRGFMNKNVCQMPLKHGLGFKLLTGRKNGAALFGAWVALIQLLSRHDAPRAGYVTHNGRFDGVPLSANDLRALTGFGKSLYEELIGICTSPAVSWLVPAEEPCGDTAADPAGSPEGQDSDPARPTLYSLPSTHYSLPSTPDPEGGVAGAHEWFVANAGEAVRGIGLAAFAEAVKGAGLYGCNRLMEALAEAAQAARLNDKIRTPGSWLKRVLTNWAEKNGVGLAGGPKTKAEKLAAAKARMKQRMAAVGEDDTDERRCIMDEWEAEVKVIEADGNRESGVGSRE